MDEGISSEGVSVKAILQRSLPDDYNAVGDTLIERIIHGGKFAESNYGRSFDLSDLINHLKEAVEFIKTVIEIYRAVKPTAPPELKKNVDLLNQLRKEGFNSLTKEEKLIIVEEIYQSMSSHREK